MADEVTCWICQRPLDPLDGKCGSDEADCLRIGYEREKARAEKAEARLIGMTGERDSEREIARGWESKAEDAQAALTAARRECEGLRTALRNIETTVRHHPEHFAGEVFSLARTALGAPAAGEEGKR